MKLTIMTAAALAATAGFGNVFLYECEKFEEKGVWKECAKCEKCAGSKALFADKEGDGAETTITTPGAGSCRSWIRTANLFATNEAPSKFTYQINGEERPITVKGERGRFVWVDGGLVMLPGGYSSIGIMPVKGSKAAVDCVVVTDEQDYRPPADEAGLKALRTTSTKE